MIVNPLAKDLDRILDATEPLWKELKNKSLFITGGTGFFGCWMLESFAWANNRLNLNAKAMVLTRNKAAFSAKCPHLFQDSSVQFHEGDVRDFIFPPGHFSHIIHAATDASVQLNEEHPLLMLDTILQGTRHTLEFAKQCGAKHFLLTSSGAVYGKQSPQLTHLSEDHPCQSMLTETSSAYAVGKCTSEHMSCLYGKQHGFDVKIARCFAFVGPYLPLDIQYAIGNFIRDGLQGGPILVNGDGTPFRSYLYAADLAIWLWTILFRGESQRPYNVGSDEAFSIVQLAQAVANNFEYAPAIKVMRPPSADVLPTRYIPDITRARSELQLAPQVDLNQAIHLTKEWYRLKQHNSTVMQ